MATIPEPAKDKVEDKIDKGDISKPVDSTEMLAKTMTSFFRASKHIKPNAPEVKPESADKQEPTPGSTPTPASP